MKKVTIFLLSTWLFFTFFQTPYLFASEEKKSDSKDGNAFQELAQAEASSRRTGGIVSVAIGATLIAAPTFSKSLDSSGKILFALGGVASLLNGVKNLYAPGQIEQISQQYALLSANQGLDPKTKAAYEETLLSELAKSSREQRLWNGVIFLGTGATMVVGGIVQKNQFSKNFSFVLGGISLLGGTMQFVKKGAAETIPEKYVKPSTAHVDFIPILIPENGTLLAGLSATLTF